MKTFYTVIFKDGACNEGYGLEDALSNCKGTIASILYFADENTDQMHEVYLSGEAIEQAQDYIDSKMSYTAEMAHEAKADYEYDKWREEQNEL